MPNISPIVPDPTKPHEIATITTLIISGFPGIGKTFTFNEIKKQVPGAKIADMDVRNYGTTNGMNVEKPDEYVRQIEGMVKDKYEVIFVSVDPVVRLKMREANLFYVVIGPEHPPEINMQLPVQFRSDPLQRALYMKRFDEIGGNRLAAQALEGRKYDDTIRDMFGDPMPKVVSQVLNPAILNDVWAKLDAQTRYVLSGLPADAAASVAAQQTPGNDVEIKFPK